MDETRLYQRTYEIILLNAGYYAKNNQLYPCMLSKYCGL